MDEDYVLIPRYSVSASAGSGLEVMEEEKTNEYAFSRKWLKAESIP